MKNTSILSAALVACAITLFAACGGNTNDNDTNSDTATYENNTVPQGDTTNTMTDTMRADSTH